MRGTPDLLFVDIQLCGIIPAYAGNTMPTEYDLSDFPDHPRVCGEHSLGGVPSEIQPGIIPAYAGNTFSTCKVNMHPWDHPRVCGEHPNGLMATLGLTGSSPRMRGTHRSRQEHSRQRGIIPAYAGNTGNTHTSTQQDRDHPRVCGEHSPRKRRYGTSWGSSPRMRGTH